MRLDSRECERPFWTFASRGPTGLDGLSPRRRALCEALLLGARVHESGQIDGEHEAISLALHALDEAGACVPESMWVEACHVLWRHLDI